MWINKKSVRSYTINTYLSFKWYTQREKAFFIWCPDIDGKAEFCFWKPLFRCNCLWDGNLLSVRYSLSNWQWSGFYVGFIVWGWSPQWPKATSFLGWSGGMLPRKFFEMNMRWDAIWCILRPNFEKCALTSSRLDDFSDIVTYIL